MASIGNLSATSEILPFGARFTTKIPKFWKNIANTRVPVLAAIEGRAHIHSDYALFANVIVAAEGATFQDLRHCAVGVVPGDGSFTT